MTVALTIILDRCDGARLFRPAPEALCGSGRLFVGAHWRRLDTAVRHRRQRGLATKSFFCLMAACWLLAWRCVTELSEMKPASSSERSILRLLIPAIFGAWILIIWESLTRGAGIPFVLLPPPSAIGARIVGSLPTLGEDVRQTIFKAVLAGYVIGCASGFVVAILADRVAFLRRGLLPIGNMVSALPIIGVAPIMVMWFGFDWQSKAAVVVIMTFFPMLVNTVAGLAASGTMERDLMQHLCLQLLADAAEASASGSNAFHFQRTEDQLDAGADRCHRRGVLRYADRRHGFPDLHRDRAHECRHGLGGNRRCGAGRLDLLRRRRPHRTGGDVLASVYPWWLGVAYSREWARA
jgi:hypothetical protein